MLELIVNESRTVGLLDGENLKDDFKGTFDPKRLKEWVDMIIQQFGPDEAVCIAIHKKQSPCDADPNCTAVMLAASAEICDSLQVCVAGYSNDEELGLVRK